MQIPMPQKPKARPTTRDLRGRDPVQMAEPFLLFSFALPIRFLQCLPPSTYEILYLCAAVSGAALIKRGKTAAISTFSVKINDPIIIKKPESMFAFPGINILFIAAPSANFSVLVVAQ